MDEDQIPDNLLPWEIEAWKESQATGQPFQGQQDTGLQSFEGSQATRMAAQGVSYNFADEAEAAAVAAATGQPYPEVIQEIRTKLKNYQMENPKAAAAWEFAGGMLPSAVLAYTTRGKAKGPVTAEQASSLFTRFFPNVAKTMGLGGAEAKNLVGGLFGGIGGNLATTAVLGFLLNKLNKNVQTPNYTPQVQAETPDYGVRLQVEPNVDQQVPVLYGSAVTGGIITEAVLSNNNRTMTYVLTLCEKTGVKISDDQASAFSFKNIYWNDNRIVFDSDGITASYMTDRDGNVDRTIAGLVRVYCYAGSSTQPVAPVGYTNPSLPYAYTTVPNWTVNHTMSDLVFAVVEIDYNRDKGITGLPTMTFNIENSMSMPGDCLYDYMTNTRYGAGVPAEEIFGE